MQDSPAVCHLSHAENRAESPGKLVHRAAQELKNTSSRHTGPRTWLRVVAWLISAGLHPEATATTLTVARELARRMDYDTGHVRYALKRTIAATGLSRAAVTKHVRVLRELGALVWVEHGTRANIRRKLGLDGYAGTATVYAATIPPAYDQAMGHRLIGSGYNARAIPTRRAEPTRTGQGKSPWTPSLSILPTQEKFRRVGGCTATAPARSAQKRTSKRRTTILGQVITARMVAEAHRLARWVRPLVSWVQRASLRQLSWVLLDLVGRGWDEQRILSWLREHTSYDRDGRIWRPRHPHRVIAAALLDEQRAEQSRQRRACEQAAAVPPNAAFLASLTAGSTCPDDDEPALDDLTSLRSAALRDPSLVVAAVELAGLEGACRIYGRSTVDYALKMAFASPNVTFHVRLRA